MWLQLKTQTCHLGCRKRTSKNLKYSNLWFALRKIWTVLHGSSGIYLMKANSICQKKLHYRHSKHVSWQTCAVLTDLSTLLPNLFSKHWNCPIYPVCKWTWRLSWSKKCEILFLASLLSVLVLILRRKSKSMRLKLWESSVLKNCRWEVTKTSMLCNCWEMLPKMENGSVLKTCI
jgi:hypothetical protein